MVEIHANDPLNRVYEKAGIYGNKKIDGLYKADFERQAYYRALNNLEPEDEKKIRTYSVVLQDRIRGCGEAAANMILFKLGLFFSEANYTGE